MAKQGGKRSPRYPAIGLKEAIEKVRKLYDADKTAGAPVEAAVRHMGYTGRTGPSNTALAALKRFGLILSKAGRVVPSQGAITILHLPEDDERRIAVLQQAALSPETYSDLFARFQPAGGIPSAESLEHDLILEGEFNPGAVKAFVKDFRESLIFAGLIDEEGVVLSGVEEAGANEDETPPPPPRQNAISPPGGSSVVRDFQVPLVSGAIAVLQVPFPMSKGDFQQLSDTLKAWEKALVHSELAVETAANEDAGPEEGTNG